VPSRDYWGPFVYNSKLFVLSYQAADTIGVYATATMDPGFGFTEQDGGNRPSNIAGGAVVACVGGASSDEIGILSIGSSSGDDPYFDRFSMSASTWAETGDEMAEVTNSVARVGLVWRPTAAEYVAVCNGDLVSAQEMAYYSRRTGVGTWSAPVALFTGTPSGDCEIFTTILGDSDKVHFILRYNGAMYIRTLLADNTLSAWPAASFESGETYEAVAAPVRYDTSD